MTTTEFIARVAEDTGLSAARTKHALKTLADVLVEQLADGEKIRLPGLGTFSLRYVAACQWRNPRTGETIAIAAHRAVSFRPAGALKEAVR
jgi:DNA-binding protein HU-beta